MIYEPLNVRRLTEEGSDQKQPPQNLKKNNTFLGLFAFNACKEFFDPLKKSNCCRKTLVLFAVEENALICFKVIFVVKLLWR